jgi:dipicolinate synthase subunit A
MKKLHSRKRLLLAGGDLRQITAAAALAGDCDVTVTGFDRFGALPDGISCAEHLSDLPQQLDALILPMPAAQEGGFLHTPFGSGAVRISALLPLVKPSGMVLGGRLTAQERGMIEAAGLRAYDYAAEETFALRNAVPTAEGAIQIAMQELPVVLQGLPVLILGAGRVSRALQPRLRALGAEVTVAARRCTDLARTAGAVGKLWSAVLSAMDNG